MRGRHAGRDSQKWQVGLKVPSGTLGWRCPLRRTGATLIRLVRADARALGPKGKSGQAEAEGHRLLLAARSAEQGSTLIRLGWVGAEALVRRASRGRWVPKGTAVPRLRVPPNRFVLIRLVRDLSCVLTCNGPRTRGRKWQPEAAAVWRRWSICRRSAGCNRRPERDEIARRKCCCYA